MVARPAKPPEVVTVGGIDPNSHRIVIVETRRRDKVKPFIHSHELDTSDFGAKLVEAFDYMVDYCIGVYERDGLYPRLFIEEPVVGRGGAGPTIAQAYVTSAIITGAVQGGSKITLVNNSSWKKRIVGNGNSNKLDVSKWVERKWRLLYERAPIINDSRHPPELRGRADQDILDAGCINKFGWWHVAMIERLWERHNGKS